MRAYEKPYETLTKPRKLLNPNPKLYPKPLNPKLYPKPLNPKLYPKPLNPKLYPKPLNPKLYPKPLNPQLYPTPSSLLLRHSGVGTVLQELLGQKQQISSEEHMV